MDGNSASLDPRITFVPAQQNPDNPGGRHKLIPNIEDVEKLAAQGLTLEEIAHNLGISDKTLRTRKEEFAEISDAIARGRARGIRKAANVLDELLSINDPRVKLDAAKFYLARRGNWAEMTKTELTGEGGGPISLQISKDDAAL